jgi:glycosyltransferase involved in cell wall biosynthesis
MIGSLDERKDFFTYIMASQKLLKKNYDMCFLIVGDGQKHDELFNSIDPIYSEMIKFLGLRKDIDAIISILDIGVLMTNNNNHREGISNVILEYMAHEKPVIASEGGGTAEIVINNETGYIIPPFSIDILANKIEYLFENPKIRQLLGKNGKKRVKENFKMDNMLDSILNLYFNLIKTKNNKRNSK